MYIENSVNQHIAGYVSMDYAGDVTDAKIRLDCSLGVNSDPLGECIFDRLQGFRQEIKYYPHDDSVREALADWYLSRDIGRGWLTAENFLLGNGSYDILAGINQLCLTSGRTVLGHAPQFTAYVDNVYCSGSKYRAAILPAADNFRFDTDAYLKMMEDDVSLFIVENPNNPTGQKLPLESVSKIAERAMSMSKVLVVDEAYADYLPGCDSAVNLVDDYPNMIVTRSFSKGWGMAGLRLGYAVSSGKTDLLEQLAKIVLPFNSNAVARGLACSVLESVTESGLDPFGIDHVRSQKNLLTESIKEFNRRYGKDLRIAETHEATPIMMISCCSGGDRFSLYENMLSKGLLTVSCDSYVGLDGRSVRLMLPEMDRTDLLIELIEEVVKDLP